MSPPPSFRAAGTRTIAAATVLLIILSLVSLFVGVSDLVSASVEDRRHLLLISRIPRTLAAVLAGSALAIAGLVMQTLVRNRLVDPMLAGTGQSAALGLLLVTIWAPAAGILAKSLAAVVVALVGTSVFFGLSTRLPPERPLLVPVFGLVYGGVIGAIATGFAWQADLLQYLDIWLNGEFSGVMRGRYELMFVSALALGAAWWVADRLTIMSMGRDVSTGLGLNYATMLRYGLALVAVLSAIVVVTVGALPFVGMVVPALMARYLGDDVRAAIPAAALSGAILVLVSDILGRLLVFPYEIPAGTILGVIGAAAFFLLIVRGRPE